MASSVVAILLALAAAPSAAALGTEAAQGASDASLEAAVGADDACAADSRDGCALHALQLQARTTVVATAAVESEEDPCGSSGVAKALKMMAPACVAVCPQICTAATEVASILPGTSTSDIGALACKYRPELACTMEHQDECKMIGDFTTELGKACDGTSEVYGQGASLLATKEQVVHDPCEGNPVAGMLKLVAPGCMAACPELCFVAAAASIMTPNTISSSFGDLSCQLASQVKCAAHHRNKNVCAGFGDFVALLGQACSQSSENWESDVKLTAAVLHDFEAIGGEAASKEKA